MCTQTTHTTYSLYSCTVLHGEHLFIVRLHRTVFRIHPRLLVHRPNSSLLSIVRTHPARPCRNSSRIFIERPNLSLVHCPISSHLSIVQIRSIVRFYSACPLSDFIQLVNCSISSHLSIVQIRPIVPFYSACPLCDFIPLLHCPVSPLLLTVQIRPIFRFYSACPLSKFIPLAHRVLTS